MKFQIKLETIKDYLRRLSVSVQSVSSRVEFTGVLINVWDNSITFEGRNDWMDTKIEETSLSTIKIIETGRVLVKANMLNEIVQKMEGQTVTFNKVDSNVLTLEDADSTYQINLLSDENYETSNLLSMNEIQQEVMIPSATFRKAISKVSFAGSDYHSKFIYQGMNLVIQEGKLTATACDGIKIASWSKSITSDIRINKIIPLKVARELVKVLPEDQEEFKFSFSYNKCLVVSGNMTNQFSLIEGTFPVFEKFFNENMYSMRLEVDKEVILNAINRATILSNIADGRIGLSINNESFTVESKEEVGSAKIEVRGYDYKGEGIDISISPKVISEGIKHASSEKVEILLKDSTSSALLKSEKDNFVYLMSPMV